MVGFKYLLPVLVTFCRRIHREVIGRKLQHVYFFSRDGLIIKKVYDSLYPGQPTTYVHASRRALTLAGITKLDNESLSFLTGTTDTTTREVLLRLGIVLGAIEGLDVRYRPKDIRLQQEILKYSQEIQARITEHRISMCQYLEREGMHRNDIAICDIGWHATMQYALDELRSKLWASNPTFGCYFGRFCASKPVDGFGYIHDMNPASEYALWGDVAFMELLFSANEPPLQGFKHGVPEFAEPTSAEKQRMLVAEMIHLGVMQGLERIKCMPLNNASCDEKHVIADFFHLLCYPPQFLCKLVQQLQHSASFTNDKYAAIIPEIAWNGYHRAQWKHGYIQSVPLIFRPLISLHHHSLIWWRTRKLVKRYGGATFHKNKCMVTTLGNAPKSSIKGSSAC